MEREQTIQVLEYLAKAYRSKIQDPVTTIDIWNDAFTNYTYEDVMPAVKLHIRRCPYFPKISEIVQNIVPAKYDKLGIPEEEQNPEELNEKIKAAVKAQKSDLERDLTTEEYFQTRSDVIKLDEIRRKNTRPFIPAPNIKLTDEDTKTLEEFIDLPWEI